MAEARDFDQQDIELVKTLQSNYATTTAQIGQVEVELHLLERRLEQVRAARTELFSTYTNLEEQEKELVKTLSSKYGDGVLDLDSGRFIPSSQ